MELSIIIPCYNVERYIMHCIDSLANLEISYEIIAVNDGSTDRTLDILKKIEETNNHLIVVNQVNSGTAHARNVGLKRSQGEYIFFLDGDDYVVAEKLQLLFYRAKNQAVDIAFGDYNKERKGQYISDKTTKNRRQKYRKLHEVMSGIEFAEKSFDRIRDYISTEICFAIFKKSFIQNNKLLFDENIYHEDTLFFYKSIICAEKVQYYDEIFYIYIIHQESKSNNVASEKKRNLDKYILAKELMRLREKNDLKFYFIDSMIIELLFSARLNRRLESKTEIRNIDKLTFRSKIKKLMY